MEIGVVIVALSRQNLPEIEARRQRLEVPFAHDSRLVTGLLQQFGHGLLRAVEPAGGIVGKTVFMTELAGNHASPAGTAQRVGHEAVGKPHAVAGDAVEIGSLDIAGIIATHHLSRMVVGHNIDDIGA